MTPEKMAEFDRKLEKQKQITGDRVKELIKEHGLSQTRAADGIGISQSVLSDIVTKKRAISAENIPKLCDYFQVSSDYLLGLTDVRARDQSIAGAAEVTGLSPEAVSHLVQLNEWSREEGIKKASHFITDRLLQEAFGKCNIYAEWAADAKKVYGHGNRYFPVPGGGVKQMKEYLQENDMLTDPDPSILSRVNKQDEYEALRAVAISEIQKIATAALDEYIDMLENHRVNHPEEEN